MDLNTLWDTWNIHRLNLSGKEPLKKLSSNNGKSVSWKIAIYTTA